MSKDQVDLNSNIHNKVIRRGLMYGDSFSVALSVSGCAVVCFRPHCHPQGRDRLYMYFCSHSQDILSLTDFCTSLVHWIWREEKIDTILEGLFNITLPNDQKSRWLRFALTWTRAYKKPNIKMKYKVRMNINLH